MITAVFMMLLLFFVVSSARKENIATYDCAECAPKLNKPIGESVLQKTRRGIVKFLHLRNKIDDVQTKAEYYD
ncbi:hypothetical protein FQR65_LT00177 [Abscondita terminalis]|nr:hypothetical protein FQR65_LT00177 [Abscondita terminalis]